MLVSNRHKPVNKPINKKTSLGPYLSKAQPPAIVNGMDNKVNAEYKLEVVARVRSNSLASGLKKTPNEKRVPVRMRETTMILKTITQP